MPLFTYHRCRTCTIATVRLLTGFGNEARYLRCATMGADTDFHVGARRTVLIAVYPSYVALLDTPNTTSTCSQSLGFFSFPIHR